MRMKVDRLLAMTMLLLNRKRISAKDLAERFEVSLRTVYRDMETIQYAGIPVVSYAGASGGYEIMEQYRLDRQFLSFDELNAIVIALRGVRPTFEDGEIEPLLDKVGALLTKSERERAEDVPSGLQIDINPWIRNTADKEKLASLREAIRNRRIIRFAYTSTEGDRSSRSCEPIRLVLKGYNWYVYGYCLLRQDYRIFRLSRIKELEVSPETFVPRPDAAPAEPLSWERGESSESLLHLVLHFGPKSRAKVEDYFDQEEITDLPDGSMWVRCLRPDEPWLYGFLLGFGADVKVLEPAQAASTLRQKAMEIIKLYPEH